MLQPVHRRRLHDDILLQIQERILSGEFPPGHRLPSERELAETLAVNRGTVREALKKLEALGLVSILHGEGIYVRDYRQDGNLELLKSLFFSRSSLFMPLLDGLMEIRTVIVPEMAGRATSRRTDDDIQAIRDIIGNGEMPLPEKDLQIHRIIARVSGNMVFLFILNYFNDIFRTYSNLYFDVPENRSRTDRFHADLLKAFTDGDPEKARKVCNDVLIYTRTAIMNQLKQEDA